MKTLPKRKAYLGLGSNLNNPQTQVEKAVQALDDAPGIQVLRCSSWYLTDPIGVTDQPDFINGVVAVTTHLSPLELRNSTMTIEHEQQRRRMNKWGPRTIDIDILLYDNIIMNHPLLTIPHRHLKERAFVLYPLVEIAPDLVLPDGESLQTVIKTCPKQGITLLEETANA